MEVFPILAGTELALFQNLESSESDSSDEEVENAVILLGKQRKKSSPVRIKNYLENVVSSYTASQFQQNFRITVNSYEVLLRLIGPNLQRAGPVGRKSIPVEKQILAVIWLLATPDSYRSVGERFDLGKSSLSVSFVRVVRTLCLLAPNIIKWPVGEHLQLCKEKFNRMGRLQNVVGCVDGTYIPIKAPQEDPQSYITRQCNYAITMQAIADPFLRFTDIFVGYPGSVSDYRIFRNSDIYRAISDNRNTYFPNNEYILGDKAYPVLQWCIAPYIDRGNLTPENKYFNTALSKIRQTVERWMDGLYFGRFRRLKYVDMHKTTLIPSVVLAACVLHNISIDNNDPLLEEYVREGVNHLFDNDENADFNNHENIDGADFRDELCRLIYLERNQ